MRRIVAYRVDRALASTFAGRVTVGRIGRLGATGTDGLDVSVQDPDGVTVLSLEDVHARVSTFAVVRIAPA